MIRSRGTRGDECAARGDVRSARPVIHGSSLPWLWFTSDSHPRRLPAESSVPKTTFGKADDTTMPVSVDVHHALMDGLHAARFFQRFEEAPAHLAVELR